MQSPRADPAGIGVEQEEENHAEGHQVHVDEQDDSAVVPAPTRAHAAEVIKRTGDCNECEDRDPWARPIVGKIGEQDRSGQAEKDQKPSSQEGSVARIEEAIDHAASDSLEGFRPVRAEPSLRRGSRI